MLEDAVQVGGNDSNKTREYIDVREQFYYDIVAFNPFQDVFLRGWLNKINDLRTTLVV